MREACALIALLFVIGCEDFDRDMRRLETAEPNAARVVGKWQTAPYLSQLGRTVDTLCFERGGKFSAEASTQAGRLTDSGAYRVSGGALLFTSSQTGKTTKSVVAWEKRDLVVKDENGLVLRYYRVSRSCR